jgi:A/G-specific adenine glycosylase
MAVTRDAHGVVPAHRMEPAWPDEVQRTRCLASLVADGLLVVADHGYALPGCSS